MAQKNARYNNKISMETTNTGDPDKRESETSADLTDAAYKLGLPPQYRDHRTDFAVLSSGLFILFSVLCKVIYLFMIFLIVMNKTLAYANLVFTHITRCVLPWPCGPPAPPRQNAIAAAARALFGA